MEQAEIKIAVTLSLYGGVGLAVFSAGLVAIVEHFYVFGAILSVVGLMSIIDAGRRALGHGFKISNRVLAGMLVLTWIFLCYDVIDRHYYHPVIGHLLKLWGGSAGGCAGVVDGTLLLKWRDTYDAALVCGVMDSSVDQFKNRRIIHTDLFGIVPADMPMLKVYDATQNGWFASAGGRGWLHVILLPKHSDLSEISTLADVIRDGGLVLDADGNEIPYKD